MYQTRDLKQELKHFAVRFSQQIMAFVLMAVCTALGYQLHATSEHVRFDALVASVFGHASTSVSVRINRSKFGRRRSAARSSANSCPGRASEAAASASARPRA